MAGMAGFEPTTFGFGDRRSSTELHPYKLFNGIDIYKNYVVGLQGLEPRTYRL